MRTNISLLSFFFLSYFTEAQVTSDALLFSEHHLTINARSMGLGNAMGALGGDLSTANLNPAGIAVYRRTEIALSVGSLFDYTTTDFIGNINKDRMSQFSFGNFGFVLPSKLRRNADKWKYVNVGVTINRLSNYARTFSFQGLSNGSRIQAFAENANGYSVDELDPFEGWVAYHSFLIDSIAPFTFAPNGGVSDTTFTYKSQRVQRKGGVNELGLTIGANYNNKLYIGATIGVDFLSMKEDLLYKESADSLDFQALDFTEERKINGTGINLKLGAIYRINKTFRIGFAIHTPTAYRLVDSYNTGLYGRIVYDSQTEENDFLIEDQDPDVLQHDLSSSWVFMGSLGMVISKRGFIGVDLEYTDYGWATFSLLENDKTPANNQFIENLNKRIQNSYQGVLKARIGAEVVVGLARIRIGYQFQSSPYREPVEGVTDFRHDISAGIGIRWKHFFLDFAYVHTLKDFEFSPYASASTIQSVTGFSQTGHAMLTIGASIFRNSM
ncbi:aromatic hydrocarbon degradation protein [Aureispira]|nr:aromatic hydrocarbon degradation protein [Aureispira sp.]